MKLELVIVLGSISREKVAVTVVTTDTPVAFAFGDLALTVGAASVVNDQLTAGASAAPSAARMVAASVAV